MAGDGEVRSITDILNLPLDGRARESGRPAPPPPPPEPSAAAGVPPSLDQLAPLPLAGDDYQPHARLANAPIPTIFFLDKSQLPDGFPYACLERVRLVDSPQAAGSPILELRFHGSVVTEVRIEGRNLAALCDAVGRHLVHWVRQHPTGRDGGGDRSVFIRQITIREVKS